MGKYLIRLDDACPTMDFAKWVRMETLLDKFRIKPLVGIIPNNEDSKQNLNPYNCDFWKIASAWQKKEWAIALHGYNHVYISQKAGVNPMWNRSEFAGVELDIQREKIRKGVDILMSHGLNPAYFFAPAHTYDQNTLTALEMESKIRIISDTIALKPYRSGRFLFIPQIIGHCVKIPFGGIYTFCFHPNTMDDKCFCALEHFLSLYADQFISFKEVKDNNRPQSFIDVLLSKIFFLVRRWRGLR